MSARDRAWRLAVVAALAVLAVTGAARAHPLSFGLLELRARGGGRYDVVFRFSGTEQQAAGAEPVLPARCRVASPVRRDAVSEGGEARRFRVDCGAAGLAGAQVGVRGMEHTGVQIVARVVGLDGVARETLLGDARRAWTVPAEGGAARTRAGYLWLGVVHIATGVDHLLFVLGLLFLAGSRRRVLAAVTAFTAGHSVTLALAALGLVRGPVAAIEAAIALSIALVAVEIARPPDAPPTLARRYPWLVAGGFGLLHGFGFAGALASVGLPRGGVALALVGFNAGVELGQLAFVALCALAARAVAPQRAQRFAAYAIGVPAVYWCCERVAAFWG